MGSHRHYLRPRERIETVSTSAELGGRGMLSPKISSDIEGVAASGFSCGPVLRSQQYQRISNMVATLT